MATDQMTMDLVTENNLLREEVRKLKAQLHENANVAQARLLQAYNQGIEFERAQHARRDHDLARARAGGRIG